MVFCRQKNAIIASIVNNDGHSIQMYIIDIAALDTTSYKIGIICWLVPIIQKSFSIQSDANAFNKLNQGV